MMVKLQKFVLVHTDFVEVDGKCFTSWGDSQHLEIGYKEDN